MLKDVNVIFSFERIKHFEIMDLSIEQLDQIEDLVKESGFSVNEVAVYLQLDPVEVRKAYQDRTSKFYKSYQRGLLMQKFSDDKALSDNTKSGDTIALQVKMKRESMQTYEAVRSSLIEGQL